jgi:hypothetical protein
MSFLSMAKIYRSDVRLMQAGGGHAVVLATLPWACRSHKKSRRHLGFSFAVQGLLESFRYLLRCRLK